MQNLKGSATIGNSMLMKLDKCNENNHVVIFPENQSNYQRQNTVIVFTLTLYKYINTSNIRWIQRYVGFNIFHNDNYRNNKSECAKMNCCFFSKTSKLPHTEYRYSQTTKRIIPKL